MTDLERLREDYDEYKRHASCGHSYATLPGFTKRADALRAALEAELAQEKAEVKCLRYYKSRYDKMRPERDTAMAANKVANALLKRAEADADTQFKLRAQAEAEATEAWQKCREHEAEVAIRDRMLDIACRSGINAVASNEATRQAMIQEVVDERLADLRARADEAER